MKPSLTSIPRLAGNLNSWSGRLREILVRAVTPAPTAPAGTSYRISSEAFLRGLGLVMAVFFVSSAVQLPGLVGTRGILPLADSLRTVAASYDARRFFFLPTLFWFGADDVRLAAACWTGTVAALSLAAGFLPLPSLLVAWILALSVIVGGAEFFDFQWDFLLLETAFAALFIAPFRRFDPCRAASPPPLMRAILLWVLFRLLFFSGLAKLVSDPSWGSLTALKHFFLCQPLPTPAAWWAAKAPDPLLRAACLAVLVIELGVPLLFFLGSRLRRTAFLILVGYQAVLLLFANTHFLHFQVMLLALLLVDDAAWQRSPLLGPIVARFAPPGEASVFRPIWAITPYALLVLLITIPQTAADLGWRPSWPEPFRSAFRLNVPLRFVNHYGYTVTSTDRRPQIVLSGTLDGREWRDYRFRWAPGDVGILPGWSSPHSPRLEARLWLASYSRCEEVPWFQQFLGRLASGSPAVLALMAPDPFAGQAPLTVRSARFDYRFTTFGEWRKTGDWWIRVERGEFCPPVSNPDRLDARTNAGSSAVNPKSH